MTALKTDLQLLRAFVYNIQYIVFSTVVSNDNFTKNVLQGVPSATLNL